MQATPLQADPIYGAQDFDGGVSVPQPDPEQPMFRGMITINVEIENFGRTHTAVFRLRPDTGRPGAPLRIFCVEQLRRATHGAMSAPRSIDDFA
ncbi:hypothetical protein [uncultured Roseovarius sp.]|uniref:hypothetical protein n=1 Tax=uncultured Roseovarius sp. TaxID=293344 RepID=UPI002614BCB3|nr:hypothetical protein [uncultured Roseovarius sp.]